MTSACLSEAPPKELPIQPVVDASCPAQFALCLDVDGGIGLESNLKAYRRWTQEAWLRCALMPDAGTAGADGGK